MWIKSDDGVWVNLDLAVQVRLEAPPQLPSAEPDHATIWFLDGQRATVSGATFARLIAELEGKPPKDSLVGAYRKG